MLVGGDGQTPFDQSLTRGVQTLHRTAGDLGRQVGPNIGARSIRRHVALRTGAQNLRPKSAPKMCAQNMCPKYAPKMRA